MSKQEEKQYTDLLKNVLENGAPKNDRTGVGCYSIPAAMMRFSLKNGQIPLLTVKHTPGLSAIREMLWFISGSTNVNTLNEMTKAAPGKGIWDQWADEEGNIGPMYGEQWRHFLGSGNETFDQINELIRRLVFNPNSRRHIITAWNPTEQPVEQEVKVFKKGEKSPDGQKLIKLTDEQKRYLQWISGDQEKEIEYTHYTVKKISPIEEVKKGRPALSACHCLVQFHTTALSDDEIAEIMKKRKANGDPRKTPPTYGLSAQLYARSQDLPIGTPFNIAQYAALVHMVAKVVNMEPLEFIWVGGDCHIYTDQVEAVKQFIDREPLGFPTLEIKGDPKNIDDIKPSDINIHGYEYHDKVSIPVAV